MGTASPRHETVIGIRDEPRAIGEIDSGFRSLPNSWPRRSEAPVQAGTMHDAPGRSLPRASAERERAARPDAGMSWVVGQQSVRFHADLLPAGAALGAIHEHNCARWTG